MMTLFEEIVLESTLLNEGVSNSNIVNAINGLHPAWIVYDDQKGGDGKNRRLIYPVAYGTSSAGNPVIRAFQPSGSSKRGLTTPPNDRELPKWKFFRTDRIKFWRTVNSNKYNPDELVGLNTSGDKGMSIVYCIAPIAGAEKIQQQKPSEKTNDMNQNVFEPKPITKDDVNGIETSQKQPSSKRYTAKNAIDSIINFIKKGYNKIFKKNNAQQNKNIESSEEKDNLNKKDTINAPETKPVTKQNIVQTDKNVDNTIQQPKDADNNPVTKQDINGHEEDADIEQENELSESFKNMMERMNNLI